MAVNTTWSNPSVSATGSGLDLATGDVLTEAVWDRLISNLNHLGKSTGTVGTRVYNSGAISIPASVQTALTFDSERWDTDVCHSTGSNTGRLVAQTAGKYLAVGNIRWTASASGTYREVLIQHTLAAGGSTNIASRTDTDLSAAVSVEQHISALWDMAVGDYLELEAFQDSATGLSILAVGAVSPEFGMIKV